MMNSLSGNIQRVQSQYYSLQNDWITLQSLETPLEQEKFIVHQIAIRASDDTEVQQEIEAQIDNTFGGLIQETVPMLIQLTKAKNT